MEAWTGRLAHWNMIKKLCLSAFVAVVAVLVALLTAEADLPLLLKRVPDGFYKDKVPPARSRPRLPLSSTCCDGSLDV